MHPFVAEQLAGARLAELRKEAEAARLARSVWSEQAPIVRRGLRAVVGGRLIRLGLRVAGSSWAIRAEGPAR